MHRTRSAGSEDEAQQDAPAPPPRVAPAPDPPDESGLTPSEVHALRRSATLTAAQSRRRGVLPG
jgi:hypothetical protein